MDKARMMTIVVGLACALPHVAAAADQPISGAKLTLRRSASGKEKLTFVSKDPAFLFPAIGSADDPGTGTPGGATIELASDAEPSGASFTAPPGVGKPGWRSKDASVDSHTYSDPAAAPGPMALKSVVLKQGKRIKITARGVGLALAGPQGAVAIRITTGALRNCVRFDGATIKRDEVGRFDAVNAAATSLSDCTNVIPSTTTTSTTASTTTSTIITLSPCAGGFPLCGACAPDETCQTIFDATTGSGQFACLCYPIGVTPCSQPGQPDYPTCGGACSGGAVCQAMKDPLEGVEICACVDPNELCASPGGPGTCNLGRCPAGQACLFVGQGVPQCGCGAP